MGEGEVREEGRGETEMRKNRIKKNRIVVVAIKNFLCTMDSVRPLRGPE